MRGRHAPVRWVSGSRALSVSMLKENHTDLSKNYRLTYRHTNDFVYRPLSGRELRRAPRLTPWLIYRTLEQ